MSLSKSVISDRRAHDRHPFRTQATLVLAEGRRVICHTLDIGRGGAAVVCDVNAPIGTAVTVCMNLPAQTRGSAMFEAQAVVANCILAPRDGGFRLGLSFHPLSAAAQAALKGYLPQL